VLPRQRNNNSDIKAENQEMMDWGICLTQSQNIKTIYHIIKINRPSEMNSENIRQQNREIIALVSDCDLCEYIFYKNLFYILETAKSSQDLLNIEQK
jgi:hypothetical protein